MSYAENTYVPVSRTKVAIEEMLLKASADRIYFASEAGRAIVGFEMRQRRIQFELSLPAADDEKRNRSKWRCLLLAIKSKLVSIEEGVETFDEAFLAQIVVGPGGETVGRKMIPALRDFYKNGKPLPPLAAWQERDVMRPPALRLQLDELIVDNFAGGGGASTGISMATGRDPDIAINHDPEALAMHAANHPGTRHLCESVWDVDPKKACGGRAVGLAWFSPDCTFHSKARGGKPHRDRNRARRRRGLAWVAVRWAEAVRPRVIALENVEEFADWGPLTADGRPDPERRGSTFQRWVARLRNLGYAVEWRELRACDYGAPTSRKRLFVIARCDGASIAWPKPSHGPRRPAPFRNASECIDWSIPVPSIFLSPDEARVWARETGQGVPRRPLADATLARIARGIFRFVLNNPRPFVVKFAEKSVGQSLDQPLDTVMCSRRFGLVALAIAHVTHHDDSHLRRADEPIPTITGAHRGELALVAPTLIQTSYGEREGQAPRTLDLHAPLGTVVAGGQKHGLVAAFLARHFGGHENDGAQLEIPMRTVTTQDHHALVSSHLVKLFGSCRDGAPVTEPLPTITAEGTHLAEVRAFLVKFYGKGATGQQAELPLGTLTTKDRFGLVTVEGEEYAIVDIGMRMLTPRELYRAQGFPADYVIDPAVGGRPLTKTAQIRMVGNSVSPPAARAIVEAQFAPGGAREAA